MVMTFTNFFKYLLHPLINRTNADGFSGKLFCFCISAEPQTCLRQPAIQVRVEQIESLQRISLFNRFLESALFF